MLTQFGREIRDMLQPGSGRDHLDVYVCFAHGNESPATLYSANVPAFMALKSVYDSSGLFSWYNPVWAMVVKKIKNKNKKPPSV
jgi:fumiquinazoline A oxidase